VPVYKSLPYLFSWTKTLSPLVCFCPVLLLNILVCNPGMWKACSNQTPPTGRRHPDFSHFCVNLIFLIFSYCTLIFSCGIKLAISSSDGSRTIRVPAASLAGGGKLSPQVSRKARQVFHLFFPLSAFVFEKFSLWCEEKIGKTVGLVVWFIFTGRASNN
jgi:hypothetical protein